MQIAQALQPQRQRRRDIGCQLSGWDEIPRAEKFLIFGLSLSYGLACYGGYGAGIIFFMINAAIYVLPKVRQDTLVNEYNGLVITNNNSSFFTRREDIRRAKEIVDYVGNGNERAVRTASMIRIIRDH
jgi:F0F1-type ATP synthase membrane subunit c/vacuolar-type H+-ATPase subunit K